MSHFNWTNLNDCILFHINLWKLAAYTLLSWVDNSQCTNYLLVIWLSPLTGHLLYQPACKVVCWAVPCSPAWCLFNTLIRCLHTDIFPCPSSYEAVSLSLSFIVSPGEMPTWSTHSALSLPSQGHTNAVNCIRFSPDGRWIASGAEDGLLKVWHH